MIMFSLPTFLIDDRLRFMLPPFRESKHIFLHRESSACHFLTAGKGFLFFF